MNGNGVWAVTYDEFMNRPMRLKKKIEHMADDVAFKLEICLKTTTFMGERVQTTRGNSMEKSLVEYIEAKKGLDVLIQEYAAAVGEVKDFLYTSLDFDDADLLEWRYISGKSLQEVADILGVAHQTAKNRSVAAEKRARLKFGTNRY